MLVLVDEVLELLYTFSVCLIHLVEDFFEELAVATGGAHAAWTFQAARRALRRPLNRDRSIQAHHRWRCNRRRRDSLNLHCGRIVNGANAP